MRLTITTQPIIVILLLLSAFVILGCQTTGVSPSTSASTNTFKVSQDSYNLFYL